MRRIIAIGGPHGSGKSSVARRLAEELQMNYISAGEIFRTIARERDVSIEQMSKLIHNEPELDNQIDERTKKLGSEENTIVDAQLAAYFTPQDIILRLCINASFETRCKRIARREGKSQEEARIETYTREESEHRRFSDLYNIKVSDLSIYDVVINNDRIDEEKTYNMAKSIVLAAFK